MKSTIRLSFEDSSSAEWVAERGAASRRGTLFARRVEHVQLVIWREIHCAHVRLEIWREEWWDVDQGQLAERQEPRQPMFL